MLRKDHRGITFVELLIAMAISTIIVAAATMFLSSAHKGYNNASASIDLQSESQVLMEQLGMWIMEGNRVQVDPGGTKLTIYQIPRTVTTPLPDGVSPSTEQASKRVIWISSSNKLYMKNITGIADPDADTTDVSAADEIQANCIGEYVTTFSPTVDGAKVTVELKMKYGTQKYEIKHEFKVRNALR